MGNVTLWIRGMRLRSLLVGFAPVVVGVSAAYMLPQARVSSRFWVIAVLCVCVALFLQIAVNYANDYSDGIRGTDSGRGDTEDVTAKPQRLTASGLVPAKHVLFAAGIWAGLACICGLVIIVLTSYFWFLVFGALCVVAAWFYTGGKHPYGYAGFGEIGVFLFFGLAPVLGTEFALTGSLSSWGIVGAIIAGGFGCVLLMTNNLRDREEDVTHGKRTLAVRLGFVSARRLLVGIYIACMSITFFLGFTPFLAYASQLLRLPCSQVYAVALCSPEVSGTIGAWLSLVVALITVLSTLIMVKAIYRKNFRPALALAGATPMLFAFVCAIQGFLILGV